MTSVTFAFLQSCCMNSMFKCLQCTASCWSPCDQHFVFVKKASCEMA